MANYLKSSDFYSSRACNTMRGLERLDVKADLSTKDSATTTTLFKGIAKMFLKGGRLAELLDESEYIGSVREIEQIVKDSFESEIDDPCDKSKAKKLDNLVIGCRRYCRWEAGTGRRDSDDWIIKFDQEVFVSKETHPNLVEMIPSLEVMPIQVKFDVIFMSKDSIEGVLYKGGVAWLGTSSTSKNKAEDDIWMNLMLKALETLVPEGEERSLTASYYHMKPKNVRPDQGNWEFISFESNSSIISLNETFCNTEEFKLVPTAQDEIIKPVLASFNEGHECSKEDCASCFLSCSCNYIKTPETMELKEKKKGKKVDPSEAQKKVIEWDNGILVVVAGAGAGKTECSAEHMLYLILKEIDAYVEENPVITRNGAAKIVLQHFFMTTFTNAGVFEMKERMMGKLMLNDIFVDPDDLQIMTFNTFAYTIDKKYYAELGFKKEPIVIDDIRNSKIIVNLLNENPVSGLNYESFTVNTKNCIGALPMTALIFDIIKRKEVDVESVKAEDIILPELGSRSKFLLNSTALSEIIDLYKKYEQELLDEGLILFSDQEPMAMRMLNKHPEYLEELGYKHLVVDEFQDSNDIQMQFVKRLVNTSSFKSLVVVGDDFQAIYGFRDTSPENMLHFGEKIGEEITQHFLVDNYRSVPEVIDLSNRFIKNNVDQIPKDLIAFRPSIGTKPVIRGFYDKDEEYEWIVKKVQEILAEGKYLPEDVCIIAGTNDELTSIGAKLSEADIPIVMKNPQKYIENSRVRAAIALANCIWAPDATENYFQYLVAKHNGTLVKEYTVDEILEMIEELHVEFRNFENLEYGYQRKVFHDKLEEIKGNDEIYQGFLDMLNVCEDFPSELDYIQDFKKYGLTAAKRMEQMYQGVVLVTAHSSKGLEWPVVINTVDGYDTEVLHGRLNAWGKQQLEEKRRLLYVSMTRARDMLYVIGKYNIREEASVKGIVTPAAENQFLHEVFDILDPKGYIPIDPNRDLKKQMRKEKAEAEKQERERRKLMRQSQKILAQYKGDKNAVARAAEEEAAKKKVRKASKARPMTDAEKLQYNNLVKDAKQISLEDLL